MEKERKKHEEEKVVQVPDTTQQPAGLEEAPKPSKSLPQLTMELEDAPGYIVFAGYYGTDEDKDGNRLVHFEYRRHHFAIEDASKALKEFKKNVVNDINKNL